MNNSLSDLLEVMELAPKTKSGDTVSIATKDSLRKKNDDKLSKRGAKKSILTGDGSFSDHSMTEIFGSSYSLNDSTSMELHEPTNVTIPDPTAKVKEGSTPKRSKRVGRKSDEKTDLERSLSGLEFDNDNEINTRRVPKDCQTVSTLDSIDREKSFNSKTSKRGGKKNSSQGKLDLEQSLSGLNCGDESTRNAKRLPSDCQTISTMNSIDKEKSFGKPAKRGGKKNSTPGQSNLERSLPGLNFEDDNLSNVIGTANDCHTVSTMDSIQREKSFNKTSKRGGRKNDTPIFQQPYEKTKSVSLSSSLTKLGGPQRDFGRQADDNDTFCDAGDNNGEASKNGKQLQQLSVLSHKQPPSPFMKSPALARSSDDSDSDDDDDDLFASFPGNNPFRLPAHL